ncbi:hypothetical protein ARMSODRAFT_975559 [Armillaria solidipes]|uniref:Uncharacterized protein n=1 Tax=Armillaria solidipes TaxID=1076256 RepID=A0A2H3BCR1_9AGAR|nr:hypothetical protein ARMSODRAFT_975559 [Armillaria solidipes]
MNEYLIVCYILQRKKDYVGTFITVLLFSTRLRPDPTMKREKLWRKLLALHTGPFNLIVVNPCKGLWYRPHNGSISFIYRGQYQILYKSIPMSEKILRIRSEAERVSATSAIPVGGIVNSQRNVFELQIPIVCNFSKEVRNARESKGPASQEAAKVSPRLNRRGGGPELWGDFGVTFRPLLFPSLFDDTLRPHILNTKGAYSSGATPIVSIYARSFPSHNCDLELCRRSALPVDIRRGVGLTDSSMVLTGTHSFIRGRKNARALIIRYSESHSLHLAKRVDHSHITPHEEAVQPNGISPSLYVGVTVTSLGTFMIPSLSPSILAAVAACSSQPA